MGADTGPANSVDIDSGPPAAATLGLTIILDGKEEEVAATGATSLWLYIATLARRWLARHRRLRLGIVGSHYRQDKLSSSTAHYFFIIPNKDVGDN